jgi:hypothetical protein
MMAAVVALGASNSYAGLVNQTIQTGQYGGVGVSYLTTGTNVNGGSVNDIWTIDGALTVNYDATGGLDNKGLITLAGGSSALNIRTNVNGPVVGTLTITQILLEDSDHDGGVLGHFNIAVSSNGTNAALTNAVAAAPTATIDFMDLTYGSAGFNNFQNINDTLTIRLWGDEIVRAETLNTGVNWGLDWMTSGTPAVPEPGTLALLIVGAMTAARAGRNRLI